MNNLFYKEDINNRIRTIALIFSEEDFIILKSKEIHSYTEIGETGFIESSYLDAHKDFAYNKYSKVHQEHKECLKYVRDILNEN